MRFIDARRLEWPKAKAKEKKHFILMRRILPFVMADLFSFVVNILLNKLYHDQVALYTPMWYIFSLISFILIGYFFGNRTWNSNVKNFDK